MAYFYNIALLPVTSDTADSFIQQAQTIANYSNGYLLAEDTAPHVTLCQFTMDKAPDIETIASSVIGHVEPMIVTPQKLNVREGLQAHAGYDWVEWLVEKTPALSRLQRAIYDVLADNEAYLVPLTRPETYSPHVTLARVAERSVDIDDLTLKKPQAFNAIPAIGLSTANGEWRETLKNF